jgi:hypothetical protein
MVGPTPGKPEKQFKRLKTLALPRKNEPRQSGFSGGDPVSHLHRSLRTLRNVKHMDRHDLLNGSPTFFCFPMV